MIVNYTPTAITKLNINKFTYSTYESLNVNALKYANDSSVIFRLMQSACLKLDNQYENMPYHIRFDYNNIRNQCIDSVNLFNLNLSSFKADDKIFMSSLYGFSKYTGCIYKLHGVYSDKEFTRFSYPCDMAFTNPASGLYSLDVTSVSLREGISNSINKPINNTKITLRPMFGFNQNSLTYIDDIIYINIEGFDISNNKVKETISITSMADFVTKNEYSFLSKMSSVGNKAAVTIDIYPYVLGEIEIWKDKIIDKEDADVYSAIAYINKEKKQLVFSRELNNPTGYPNIYDTETNIDLVLGENEIIYSYVIDNDLIYVTTSGNKIYCFPLIVPYIVDTSYDNLKTREQAIKVTYYNDEIHNSYKFTIIPSSKTNDIEILNIFINGETYQEGLLLDLYREQIEDNRIEIPHSKMFDSEGKSVILFETSGAKQCTLPVVLLKRKLDALFIKDLSQLTKYKENDIEEYSSDTSVQTYFITNYTYSTFPKYKDPNVTGYSITPNSKFYKLSNSKYIILDNYIISNVYNTFYFEKDTAEIVTHDAITSLRLDNSSITSAYENLKAAISGMSVSGLAITGLEN